MLTDLIRQVHAESKGTYGIQRVHAELTLGRGVQVGHNQVELLMRRAGLRGVTGRRKWKRILPDTIATDLVERDFNSPVDATPSSLPLPRSTSRPPRVTGHCAGSCCIWSRRPHATSGTSTCFASRPTTTPARSQRRSGRPGSPSVARTSRSGNEGVCRRCGSSPDCGASIEGCRQMTIARPGPRSRRTTAAFRQVCGSTKPSRVSTPSRCQTPKRGATWTSTEPCATTDNIQSWRHSTRPHMARSGRAAETRRPHSRDDIGAVRQDRV